MFAYVTRGRGGMVEEQRSTGDSFFCQELTFLSIALSRQVFILLN